jgi:cob(I)alamin adenosyltransferase
VRGAVEPSARAHHTHMNTSNEAILALLFEIQADLAELKQEVATLTATNQALLNKVEVIDNKVTYLAEEMGMI